LFLLIYPPLLIFLTDLYTQFRQAKISYTGSLKAKVWFHLDGEPPISEQIDFGQFPIMVKVGIVFLFVLVSKIYQILCLFKSVNV
jgi:hypothetical protein